VPFPDPAVERVGMPPGELADAPQVLGLFGICGTVPRQAVEEAHASGF
jgi:hypothetical protein